MVFAPFWFENGHGLSLFWSEVAYGFRGNSGVHGTYLLVSIPNE